MNIEITNWKDLKEQFGLEDTLQGLLSAKQISRQLERKVRELKEPPPFIAIECNTNSEAIACFNLHSVGKFGTIFYTYNGTAN